VTRQVTYEQPRVRLKAAPRSSLPLPGFWAQPLPPIEDKNGYNASGGQGRDGTAPPVGGPSRLEMRPRAGVGSLRLALTSSSRSTRLKTKQGRLDERALARLSFVPGRGGDPCNQTEQISANFAERTWA